MMIPSKLINVEIKLDSTVKLCTKRFFKPIRRYGSFWFFLREMIAVGKPIKLNHTKDKAPVKIKK
ncbi:hypothetical protein DZF79_15505 [Vibrio parahaemolyticus]|nr:hypothetical protein [Vibrio parahaemolyticus]